MKVFVTGGAGYIGSHTCKNLAASNHEVIVYDNLSTGHRDFVKWGAFEHGDINDTQKLRSALKKHKPDCVIHFAAKAYVGESVINPGKYFRNNVCGTLSLLEAMRDEEVNNIVVSGTCAVYGQPETVPINEDEKALPLNPYGASKLFMERMLEDFSVAHGTRWVSLRYFNAAGCDPDGEVGELHLPETHLIPRVILATIGLLPAIEVYGTDYPTKDGTCIRDYIHVNDLARAHSMAAEYLKNGGQNKALNLGTGKGSSVNEIIRGVEKLAQKKVPFTTAARRQGDPACLVADAELASKTLGWKAEKTLEQMLADSWKFTRARQSFFK